MARLDTAGRHRTESSLATDHFEADSNRSRNALSNRSRGDLGFRRTAASHSDQTIEAAAVRGNRSTACSGGPRVCIGQVSSAPDSESDGIDPGDLRLGPYLQSVA